MYCKYCGQEIEERVRFCPNCGQSTRDDRPTGYTQNDPNHRETDINENASEVTNGNSKVVAIVAYITWIGFIIAAVLHDKNDDFAIWHLNQALVLNVFCVIFAVVALIPIIGTIAAIVFEIIIFIGWVMGIISAAMGNKKKAPLFGNIHWLNKNNA